MGIPQELEPAWQGCVSERIFQAALGEGQSPHCNMHQAWPLSPHVPLKSVKIKFFLKKKYYKKANLWKILDDKQQN